MANRPMAPEGPQLSSLLRQGEVSFDVNFNPDVDRLRDEWIVLGQERTITLDLPKGQKWPKDVHKGMALPISVELDFQEGQRHEARVNGKVLWRRNGRLVVEGRIEMITVVVGPTNA